MSLTTVNVYNLTSAQSDFTISFAYQKQSYVSVKVEDEALLDVSSNYSGVFTDATTYQFQDSGGNPEQIPSGYRVTFTRDTDISDDLFTFAAGTVIRPDALGNSLKTLRDYTEEKNDQTANVTINIANDAITTATTTATNKASEAAGSASAAAGSASAASTSEGNALTYKNQAFDYTYKAGNTPTSNAEYFKEQAEAANSTAQTAQTAAVAAKDAIFDIYLGSYADETALNTYLSSVSYTKDVGDLFYDQSQGSNGRLMVWNGSTWTPAASEAAATAAEAAKDTVLDVVLGSFADDAAVDTYLAGVDYTKDSGDLYFNTTDGLMKVYSGSAWIDIANTASSVAANDAKVAAEAALNTFVNRYLGSYTNAAGNDAEVTTAKSSVIDAGDIYFDSTNAILRYFDGSSWHPAAATQVLNTSSLGNVGDVDYTSAPQTGDYFRRNASNQWERRSVAQVKSDLNLPANAASDISANAAAISANDTDITNINTSLGNKLEAVNLGYTPASTQGTVTNDAGNDATIPVVDSTNAGLMTPTMFGDLGNKIEAANLGYTPAASQGTVTSDAGNDAVITVVDNTNAGLMTPTMLGTLNTVSGKQEAITTSSGTINAQSLTTYVTGDTGSVSVDVRKANPRTTTGTHTLLGGATMYYANAAATYDTASLTPGDIVTIYNEGGGTVTVNTGGTVSLFKDGEASAVTAAVTIGADTIATVTCVSATKAIIAGSALT